jgi:hypothetical protein
VKDPQDPKRATEESSNMDNTINAGAHITLSADEQEETAEILTEQTAMATEHHTVLTPEQQREWGMDLAEAEKRGALSDGSDWSEGDISGFVAGAALGQG